MGRPSAKHPGTADPGGKTLLPSKFQCISSAPIRKFPGIPGPWAGAKLLSHPGIPSFLFMAEQYSMYGGLRLSIQQLMDTGIASNFGCCEYCYLHIHIGVFVCMCVFSSLGYIPSSRTTRAYSNLNFLRKRPDCSPGRLHRVTFPSAAAYDPVFPHLQYLLLPF